MSASQTAQTDALYKKYQVRTSQGINTSINNEMESLTRVYSPQIARQIVPEDESVYLASPSSYPWIVQREYTYINNPATNAYTDSRIKNIIPFYNSSTVFGVSVAGTALSSSQYTLDYDTGTIVLYYSAPTPPTIRYCEYTGSYYKPNELLVDASGTVALTANSVGNLTTRGSIGIGQLPTAGVMLDVSGTTRAMGSVGIDVVPAAGFQLDVSGTARTTRLIVGRNTNTATGIAASEIRFGGLQGDFSTDFSNTVISERIYRETEKSELLLFKGNDIDGGAGPDRIRLKAANVVIQTYSQTQVAGNEDPYTDTSSSIVIDGNAFVNLYRVSNDATGGTNISFYRERQAANPGMLRDDDFGRIRFLGKNTAGTMTTASAMIRASAAADANSTAPVSSYLTLWTTPIGTSTALTERMRIDASGNVGIATATPEFTLDVSGTARTTRLIVGRNTNTATGIAASEIRFGGLHRDFSTDFSHTVISERIYGETEKSELLLFKANDASAPAGPDRIRLKAANVVFQTYSQTQHPGTEDPYTDTSNSIVIDENAFVNLYQVSNNATGGTNISFYRERQAANPGMLRDDDFGRIRFLGKNTAGTMTTASAMIRASAAADANSTAPVSSYLTLWTTPIGTSTALTERMRIDASGNVGIATATPEFTLDVNGTTRTTGLIVGRNTATGTAASEIRFGGVNGDFAANFSNTVISERRYGTGEQSELLLFKGDDTDGPFGPDRIRLKAGSLVFQTYSAQQADLYADAKNAMVIDSQGDVGIGTTTPQCALDVSGTLRIQGPAYNVSGPMINFNNSMNVRVFDFIANVNGVTANATTSNYMLNNMFGYHPTNGTFYINLNPIYTMLFTDFSSNPNNIMHCSVYVSQVADGVRTYYWDGIIFGNSGTNNTNRTFGYQQYIATANIGWQTGENLGLGIALNIRPVLLRVVIHTRSFNQNGTPVTINTA